MSLRIDEPFPTRGLELIRECYRYVNHGWQHAVRLPIPDQGFEVRFREMCVQQLVDWTVSQHRELHLGCGFDTASGVNHEVDLVVRREGILGVLELKNRQGFPPEKNDVIVFFAKILDYLALTPSLLKADVVPVFMSSTVFERSGLTACLGLGIHPVAPLLRPLPLLVHNAQIIQGEIAGGAVLANPEIDDFGDYCAGLNRMNLALSPAAINRRCDYFNDDTITVTAVPHQSIGTLADDLLRLNAQCARLLDSVRAAKANRSNA